MSIYKAKKSEIRITFYLVGKNGLHVDLNYISERLNLFSTKTRTPDDWPDYIKNPNNELPDELKPRYLWEFDMQYEKCNAVSTRFEEMLKIFKDKAKIINELKDQFILEAGFEVGIHAQHDQGNLPEMCLTKEIIMFAASIEADIGFDMYLD